MLGSFSIALDALVRSPDELIEQYRSVLSTIGWVVQIESGGTTWVGEATDVDAYGRLVVVNDDGTHHVDASEVIHLRPI